MVEDLTEARTAVAELGARADSVVPRLPDLLDMSLVQKLCDASYTANGMPIGIVDARDGAVLVGCGWQDICLRFHRAYPESARLCEESDRALQAHLSAAPYEYACKNGLRDIGIPIVVAGQHLASMFLGQFFYEDESPDRERFVRQARTFGYPEAAYLDALDRVPVFSRRSVENIVAYDAALSRFLAELAEGRLASRRAEEALRDSERRLRALADSMPHLAWTARPDGYITWYNRRWYAYTGTTPERMEGWGWQSVHDPATLPDVMRRWQASIASGTAFEMEFPLRGADGTFRRFLTRCYPLKDAAGRVVQWFGTNTDVTELVEAQEVLRDSDRRKSEFIAVLSHELRNPLAPIRNGLYLLERAAPGSAQAERAREIIRRQADHLTRLVDDLLDVTRISRSRIELTRRRIDLREVVERACGDHAPLLAARGLELRVDAPPGPVWIDADETRIAQVIGNLLQNAARFSPGAGTVAVRLDATADRAELHVKDDGIGIAPELLPRVFEPFVQADAGLARRNGGLGLGLAFVKGLVALHGGSVRALSDGPGRGAELVVTLPLPASPGALPAP